MARLNAQNGKAHSDDDGMTLQIWLLELLSNYCTQLNPNLKPKIHREGRKQP